MTAVQRTDVTVSTRTSTWFLLGRHVNPRGFRVKFSTDQIKHFQMPIQKVERYHKDWNHWPFWSNLTQDPRNSLITEVCGRNSTWNTWYWYQYYVRRSGSTKITKSTTPEWLRVRLCFERLRNIYWTTNLGKFSSRNCYCSSKTAFYYVNHPLYSPEIPDLNHIIRFENFWKRTCMFMSVCSAGLWCSVIY